MTTRTVAYRVLQAVFSVTAPLKMVIGVGYFDDDNNFVQLSTINHTMSAQASADFLSANTPETPVSRQVDMAVGMSAYLMANGVIESALS